jgi:hypothetical protein
MYETRTVVGQENGKPVYGLTTTHPDLASALDEALDRRNESHIVLTVGDFAVVVASTEYQELRS